MVHGETFTDSVMPVSYSFWSSADTSYKQGESSVEAAQLGARWDLTRVGDWMHLDQAQ